MPQNARTDYLENPPVISIMNTYKSARTRSTQHIGRSIWRTADQYVFHLSLKVERGFVVFDLSPSFILRPLGTADISAIVELSSYQMIFSFFLRFFLCDMISLADSSGKRRNAPVHIPYRPARYACISPSRWDSECGTCSPSAGLRATECRL